MTNLASKRSSNLDLPKGIQQITDLPNAALGQLWDSIFIDKRTKDQLLNQAVLNFTVRTKVDRTVLPLHGVILLVGPPGTGKTSLAKGLAHRVAVSLKGGKFSLVEIEPHGLTSSAHGKTQQAVSQLFSESIALRASGGPCIVLLDEVETLAIDRAKTSLEANPVDVHRATDAVLVQLDLLADRFPNLLFVATSNFPQAVDAAFTSRCDLILDIPLPDKLACTSILKDCLNGLAKTFPRVSSLVTSSDFERCASACVGLDGRAIRKAIAAGLARRIETSMDPNHLTLADIIDAASAAKRNKPSVK